jgi:hypothetical protein
MDVNEPGPSQPNKRPLDPTSRTPLPKRPNVDPERPSDEELPETDTIRVEVSKVILHAVICLIKAIRVDRNKLTGNFFIFFEQTDFLTDK